MATHPTYCDFHRPDQHHGTKLTLNARPGAAGYADDDDDHHHHHLHHHRNNHNNNNHDHSAAIAAPAVFEGENMQRPDAPAQLRRASSANNAAIVSPSNSIAWDYSAAMNGDQVPPSVHPNTFARHMPPRVHFNLANAQHPHHLVPGWPVEHAKTEVAEAADLVGPMMYENMQHHATNPSHEGPQTSHGMHAAMSAPPPPAATQFAFAPQDEGAFNAHPTGQLPMSPHSHDDYLLMAAREREHHSNAKRSRPTSPTYTTVDHYRGDGVRKRNGRIPIPPERTISNIDELIDRETNENEKKNLKQQKRLLRNREAALASRQRKKKHTEELEHREKDYTRSIEQLRTDLMSFRDEAQRHEQAYQALFAQYSHLQREVQLMAEEKRASAQRHEEETSQLRKRINLLNEQLENAANNASAMSVAPSSTGYTDFNAEMDALTVGSNGWDNFVFVNDMHDDQSDVFNFQPQATAAEQAAPTLHKKSSSSTVRALSVKDAEAHDDNSVSSSLLFFLLLCGAFVASNPVTMRSSGLPQVPPDVRAAAPTILNNLLSEPISLHSRSNEASQASMSQPGPSSIPFSGDQSNDRIGHMHERLTTPHKSQEVESAFSLTQSQYASIANLDQPHLDGHSRTGDLEARHSASDTGPSRPNLAETLANMQSEHARQNPAAVYTRSLLWEQIPADVVRQFKEMVREQAEAETPKHTEIRAYPNPALHTQQVQQDQPSHDQHPSKADHNLPGGVGFVEDDFDMKVESFNDYLSNDDFVNA